MNAELWLDNCINIDIHYNAYPVEPHFNFIIKAVVPGPYQAQDREEYFDHHEDSTLARYTEIDSERMLIRGTWFTPRYYWTPGVGIHL